MIPELMNAVDFVSKRDDVTFLVLYGEGRFFSSGADIVSSRFGGQGRCRVASLFMRDFRTRSSPLRLVSPYGLPRKSFGVQDGKDGAIAAQKTAKTGEGVPERPRNRHIPSFGPEIFRKLTPGIRDWQRARIPSSARSRTSTFTWSTPIS